MRKFYVLFYNKNYYIVAKEIELNHDEKANIATFLSKINEIYFNNNEQTYNCNFILSWSLIEE